MAESPSPVSSSSSSPSIAATQKKDPHVMVLPYPLIGHINPCLHISQILASHGCRITFIVPEYTLQEKSMADQPNSRIHVIGIPDNLPPSHPRHAGLPASLELLQALRPGVESLLQKLQQAEEDDDEDAGPVSCIVADTFVTWSHGVASQFRIPRFALYSSGAHACSVMFHAPLLASMGLLPFKGNGFDYDPSFVIDCIPGVPPLHPLDFPFSMRYKHQFVLDQMEHIDKAEGIILNTFYEMESTTIDTLRKEIPIYPIGFILSLCAELGLDTRGSIGYWPEDEKCIDWLNLQSPSSVLYVSFGSLATMQNEQIRELANGLDCSEQPFLWVIRPDILKGSILEVLPEGFMERTQERGLIVTWAPQLRVLSHPSVHSFMTHCGWNSITENLCTGGVPMICWPHVAEQRLNCKLLVEVWKIGEELKRREDGMVRKEEVERAVRVMMREDGGSEKRRRAAEMKDKARRAVKEGGSSVESLKALVEAIRKKTLATK